MCGRFTLHSSPGKIAERFRVPAPSLPELEPRYNIAPTQDVLAVARSSGGEGRSAALLRWGLVPHWSREPDGAPLINARSETAAELPAFRDAFRSRRCLVVADGFYEWSGGEEGERQPWYIRSADGGPFAFAGLWDRWTGEEGRTIDSCTILTTEPDEVVAELHERMPVILGADAEARWLDPRKERHELESLLSGPPGAGLEAYRVSRRVNRYRNDDPSCIEPAAE